MLKRKIFDPSLPYRVVLYLRMSSDLQNKRSPAQQRAEIERLIKALGYNWQIVGVYVDEAISGKLLRQRHQYQRMLRDIRTGELAIDLILVDTLERFGRVDELAAIRKKLLEKYGVLVLTADSGFVDPTTPAGRALGAVESIRATEHGRVLAHNVYRGKRDAVQLKRWPGGAPPFGFMLKSILKMVNGREEVDYTILIRNPVTAWIIVLLFEEAAKTGWGTMRLAQFLTDHPDIPEDYKPFQPETIGYWLDQEIYYGLLVWPKHSTEIVDERLVREANAESEILRIPEYCEALVPHELWNEVQRLRQLRRDRIAAARTAAESNKLIVAPSPGMSLKYLLSGLVFCGACGLRMVATPSSPYTTKSGETKRYTSYVCPGYKAGHCKNSMPVPEEWLRGAVVGSLREKLFPWTA